MTEPNAEDRRAERGLFAVPINQPVRTLLVAAGVVLIAVLLIGTMRTDGSLAALLPAHESSSAALAAIGENFEAAEQATLLVRLPQAADANGLDGDDMVAFAERFERAVDGDGEAQGLIKSVKYVWPDDAEPFARDLIVPNLVLYLDEEGQAELSHRLSRAGMAQQMRMNEQAAAAPGVAGSSLAALLEDPLRLRELVQGVFEEVSPSGGRPGKPMLSADRRSLMIHITPAASTTSGGDANATMAVIRRAIDTAEPGELDVAVTGGVAIAQAAERSIRGDMIASSIGTMILLQLLFLATYRRLLLFPIAFLPAAAGVVVGFGVFALTGRAISPPTAVLGALLAGLGIDYAIHYLAHAHEHPALAHTSRRLAPPLAMACVTSAIAFSTVGISDVTALRDFAVIGTVGLVATLLATLTVLPALLTLIQRRHRRIESATPTQADRPRWRLDAVLNAAVRQRKFGLASSALLVLTSAALLLLLPGGPIRFDRDLSAMHPQPNPPLETQQRLSQAFPGLADTLMLYVTAENDEQLLQRTAEARQRLARNDQASAYLAGTFGLDQMIPPTEAQTQRRRYAEGIDTNTVLAAFDQTVEASIFDPAAFADYRDYLQQMLRPGPGPRIDGLDRYPGITSGMIPRSPQTDETQHVHATIITVFLREPLDDREQRAEAIESIRGAVADLPGVTLTGMPVVGHDVERLVQRDLSRLLAVASVVVTLWLLLCFRNLRDTATALIPVVGGMTVLFAFMLVSGTGLNLINLVALPLLAGLGVDDGLFLVSIARDARRRGLDRTQLIAALSSSAQAVTLTSATTALAFGSLMLTGVPAIRSLGIVMAVGIVACLLLSVCTLAPLLVMLHRPTTATSTDGAAA